MNTLQAIPQRGPTESYIFLSGTKPNFEGEPVNISPVLTLYKVGNAFLEELSRAIGISNVRELAQDCSLCVHCTGNEFLLDVMRPYAFHLSLILATDVRCRANRIQRCYGVAG